MPESKTICGNIDTAKIANNKKLRPLKEKRANAKEAGIATMSVIKTVNDATNKELNKLLRNTASCKTMR